MKLISRYLSRELWIPLVATCVLTILVGGLSQLIKMATEISGLGISVWDLLRALPFAIPSFLGMGLPIAYLLALVVAFGRISEDREFSAMAAAGISTQRIFLVPFTWGVLLTLVGMAMTIYVEPYAIKRLRKVLVSSAAEYFAKTLEPKVIHDDLPDIMIYFAERNRETGEMKDIVIADDRDRARPTLLTAASGQVDQSDGSNVYFLLRNGELQQGNMRDPVFRRIGFASLDYRLDTGIFVHRTASKVPALPELTVNELRHIADDPTRSDRDRQRHAIALYRKFSFPTANLVFVFLVFPLVTVLSRPSRVRAYVVTVLLVSIYFVLAQATEVFVGGGMSTFVATWIPNFIFLGVGGALTYWRVRQ